jgi:hypothetical protein
MGRSAWFRGMCGTRRAAWFTCSGPPRGRLGWTRKHRGILRATGTPDNNATRMGPAHASPTTCLQHILMQRTSRG